MSGPSTTLALRRRTLVERKVLALLRGAEIAAQSTGVARLSRMRTAAGPTPPQAQHFAELRRFATRHGFNILDRGAPYMSADELTLLSWLASAQRVSDPQPEPPGDPAFAAALLRCAGLLDGMGLRLSSLTLYGVRLRADCRPDRRAPMAVRA